MLLTATLYYKSNDVSSQSYQALQSPRGAPIKFSPSFHPYADKSTTAEQIFAKFNSRGFYRTLSNFLNFNKTGQKLGTPFMKTRASLPAPSNLPDTPREGKGKVIALDNNEQTTTIFRVLCCPISGITLL
jgi:hypothetical protein